MKKTFRIQNLKCGGCENTILNALLGINGVQNIAVHTDENSIALTYKDEDVYENVRAKLSKIGYPVVGDKNTVLKKAASYVSCAIGKVNT